MKTQIMNIKNGDYSGETTDLTVDIKNVATWCYNDYYFTLSFELAERSRFDVKRNEAWATYKLDGNDWSDTLHNGHIVMGGFDGMNDNEIICTVIRAAHAWICNHV